MEMMPKCQWIHDFSWQREYHFEPMLEVPAGSKLIADYVYDNSEANKSNPDPKKDVTFGEQTSEEMLFTFLRFRFKGETTTDRHDDWSRDLQAGIIFGALDDDMDGKISSADFRRDPRFAGMTTYLALVDADKDGALSKVEFTSVMTLMQTAGGGRAGPFAALRQSVGQ